MARSASPPRGSRSSDWEGLGSHGAQQLAYLGVPDLAFVDDDIVTASSMNRVVGATDDDVAAGRKKVEVAGRVAKAILCDARITAIPERLETDPARSAIARCDSVFSCLDEPGSAPPPPLPDHVVIRALLDDLLDASRLVPVAEERSPADARKGFFLG